MSEQLSREEQLKRKRAYWKRQIESWQGSGMSQSNFCRKHNLKPYLFTYWKKRTYSRGYHPARQFCITI